MTPVLSLPLSRPKLSTPVPEEPNEIQMSQLLEPLRKAGSHFWAQFALHREGNTSQGFPGKSRTAQPRAELSPAPNWAQEFLVPAWLVMQRCHGQEVSWQESVSNPCA